MPAPFPDRSGLQPERTGLAWQRTAITSTVAQVALVAIAVRLADWVLVVVFSVAAIIGAVLVLGVRLRLAELRIDRASPPYAAMVRVAAATGLTAIGGLMAAVRLYAG